MFKENECETFRERKHGLATVQCQIYIGLSRLVQIDHSAQGWLLLLQVEFIHKVGRCRREISKYEILP